MPGPAANAPKRAAHARRELLLALALAVVLILARSAVFIVYEQAFFDSDQAIVGLMAKHLIEGRAFPLFYYGQIYMLGVDSWIAAPVFALLGPTVPALHFAIALANIVAAFLLIVGFTRSDHLRPWLAIVASSFFLFAPPFTSKSLIEAGANIGPFIYIAAMWLLRDRPLWFGLVLGLGFVNREFTIYAVPALLVIQLCQGTLFHTDRLRTWLLAAVATAATWQVIQALKPYADMMGPGSRGQQLGAGDGGEQLANIGDRVGFSWSDLPARAHAIFFETLPRLYGTVFVNEPVAAQGYHWMFWPFLVVMFLVITRALVVGRRERTLGRATFGFYLLLVGLAAATVPILTRPVDGVADRYVLLGLFVPIGVVGVHLALEPRRALRWGLIAFVMLWMALSGVDHLAHAERYVGGHEPNPKRHLVDALLARGITVAQSNYWRAYAIAFISGERVKVASTDVIRISEYQDLANAVGPSLVTIQETPCGPGEHAEHIDIWYLCQTAR